MWFTRVSIQHPVFATMVMLAFVVVGLLSGLSLFSFVKMTADAGDEIAGRQQVRSRRFDA